ncbi:hypothetical protein [Aurantimonas sp. Leaf443]|uniref:hypothetical protein n=1 Tax=Aurantimonas sp. Leaf443 TaxID=1736378 RepID=UPI0006FC6E83|nr:hypothetical protein [Aurantimonas sp. Leaf443]KQT83036.1 hypothetical protein ASG48_13705 [Aurantimonas sp. Leaf443]
MRFVIRALGFLATAFAVVLAIGDIARSLADERMELASVSEILASAGASPAAPADPQIADLVATLLAAPASPLLFALGLVLIALSRRPHRSGLRRLSA